MLCRLPARIRVELRQELPHRSTVLGVDAQRIAQYLRGGGSDHRFRQAIQLIPRVHLPPSEVQADATPHQSLFSTSGCRVPHGDRQAPLRAGSAAGLPLPSPTFLAPRFAEPRGLMTPLLGDPSACVMRVFRQQDSRAAPRKSPRVIALSLRSHCAADAALTNRPIGPHRPPGPISGSLEQLGHRQSLHGWLPYLLAPSRHRSAFVAMRTGLSSASDPEATGPIRADIGPLLATTVRSGRVRSGDHEPLDLRA